MARLPDLKRFRGCPIPQDDPLRLYYYPVVGRFYRRRIDVSMALIGRGERILEVGYGSGTTFLELSSRFDEISGMDMHDYGPSIKRLFVQEGINMHLVRGSILDPPYEDSYFDAVLAISILEHLRPADQPRVMAQISRLLRPGGIFVVGLPGVNSMMKMGFRMLGCDISKHHFSTPNDVVEAAARVFSVDRIVRQPWFAHDSFLLYVWFRARKI